jgi:hypothetical protein
MFEIFERRRREQRRQVCRQGSVNVNGKQVQVESKDGRIGPEFDACNTFSVAHDYKYNPVKTPKK